jgi:hypothetical protein
MGTDCDYASIILRPWTICVLSAGCGVTFINISAFTGIKMGLLNYHHAPGFPSGEPPRLETFGPFGWMVLGCGVLKVISSSRLGNDRWEHHCFM